jgi:hypothetical protein
MSTNDPTWFEAVVVTNRTQLIRRWNTLAILVVQHLLQILHSFHQLLIHPFKLFILKLVLSPYLHILFQLLFVELCFLLCVCYLFLKTETLLQQFSLEFFDTAFILISDEFIVLLVLLVFKKEVIVLDSFESNLSIKLDYFIVQFTDLTLH